MTMTRAGQARFQAPWLLPVGALVAVIAALVGIVWISGRVGGDDQPPPAPPFQAPSTTPGYTRFTVKQVADGRITVQGDTPQGQAAPAARDLTLAPTVAVEGLQRIQPAALRAGEPIAVVGIPNEVRNFSIHALIAFAQPVPADADRVVRSPAGFSGAEALPDARDRVIISGTLERVAGATLTLQGPTGPIELTVTAQAPLYRLGPATVPDIREGDRIAVPGDGTQAGAVLVGTAR